MSEYAISEYVVIENDDGLLVVGVAEDQTKEQVALANGGVIVDEGPYHAFDEAYDAMLLIPDPIDDLHGSG